LIPAFNDGGQDELISHTGNRRAGGLAGWLAGRIMRGGGFGLIGDIVVGIAGSVVGSQVFGLLGIRAGGIIGVIVTATAGALILLYLIRLVKRV
jgi:uncharacterized membrane protein YeaQ/YmgE (transglycosylase-associated protein family)